MPTARNGRAHANASVHSNSKLTVRIPAAVLQERLLRDVLRRKACEGPFKRIRRSSSTNAIVSDGGGLRDGQGSGDSDGHPTHRGCATAEGAESKAAPFARPPTKPATNSTQPQHQYSHASEPETSGLIGSGTLALGAALASHARGHGRDPLSGDAQPVQGSTGSTESWIPASDAAEADAFPMHVAQLCIRDVDISVQYGGFQVNGRWSVEQVTAPAPASASSTHNLPGQASGESAEEMQSKTTTRRPIPTPIARTMNVRILAAGNIVFQRATLSVSEGHPRVTVPRPELSEPDAGTLLHLGIDQEARIRAAAAATLTLDGKGNVAGTSSTTGSAKSETPAHLRGWTGVYHRVPSGAAWRVATATMGIDWTVAAFEIQHRVQTVLTAHVQRYYTGPMVLAAAYAAVQHEIVELQGLGRRAQRFTRRGHYERLLSPSISHRQPSTTGTRNGGLAGVWATRIPQDSGMLPQLDERGVESVLARSVQREAIVVESERERVPSVHTPTIARIEVRSSEDSSPVQQYGRVAPESGAAQALAVTEAVERGHDELEERLLAEHKDGDGAGGSQRMGSWTRWRKMRDLHSQVKMIQQADPYSASGQVVHREPRNGIGAMLLGNHHQDATEGEDASEHLWLEVRFSSRKKLSTAMVIALITFLLTVMGFVVLGLTLLLFKVMNKSPS